MKRCYYFLFVAMCFSSSLLLAQQKKVTGIIMDTDGSPLPGANVLVKDAKRGTQADFDGRYSIDVLATDVLEFSYVQYETQRITVGTKSKIDVLLKPDNELEAVVITGYSSFRKDKVTSSVSVVAPKEIEQVPIASLDQVLQGRVAGLNVSTGSGQPGQQGTITIRGINSFNGDTEPLFVIDGVFVDQDNFRSLNSNDIENISVLKDASASALYGSRAAGGVIVIATKRGKFNSPLAVSYRSQYGISSRPKPKFDLLNSQQLLEYQRTLGVGAGNGLTDQEIAELAEINTDWTDILFREGTTISHEINLSKGGDNSRTFTSLGYFKQEGITLGSELQRFTFRTNNDMRTDKFSFSTNVTANFSQSDFVVDRARNTTGGSLDNPFIVPYIGLPFQDPYNPDGSLNIQGTVDSGGVNEDGSVNTANANGFLNTPFIALNTGTLNSDDEEELRIIGSLDAKYEVLPNVKIGTLIGVDFRQENQTNITTPGSIRGIITPSAAATIKGSRSESDVRDLRFNFNTSIGYANTFNDVHDFEVSIFTEYNKRHTRFFGFTGFGLNPLLENSINGLTNGQVIELDASGAETRPYIPNVFGSEIDRGLFSYFGVLRYGYDGKYDFQASVRRDGSSFFPDENEFGTFFAVSGRWNVSKEDFWGDERTVNNLALRASYGTVGNQELGIPFGQFNLFASGTGYNSTPAIVPSAIGNNKLKWEETTQANIGIDFGLFKDRLKGTLDVYQNTTKDALLFRPVSLTSGFTSFPDNVGSLRNSGVDLEVNYALVEDKINNFYVNIYANANYNKNEILSLFGGEDRVGALGVGQSVGEFRLVRYAGVNPANGEPLYLDANGAITNVFNPDDAVFLDKGSQPKYAGGFGTDISYKGFSLNMLWSFAAEQYRTNGSLAVIEDVDLVGFANQSTTMLNAWSQPGDITDIPNPQLGGFRFQAGDRYLENSSFLRLRNVVLAYTLDGAKFKKKPFQSARLYVQGQNAITFTRWRGFDPETNTGSSFFDFPTARTFTVGLDVNF